MKKLFFLSLLFIASTAANAQETNIHEDFNAVCASGTGHPMDWLIHNEIDTTAPLGAWMCTSTEGREGTPGMECTGDYNGIFHIDTSLMITPLLNLSSYSGRVFLNFDGKVDFLSGERLAFLESADTAFDTVISPVITLDALPAIGAADSEGWTTHQIELTSFKTSGNFYIAFQYISPNTYGNKWHIDNVNTTTFPLEVNNVQKNQLPLVIVGQATTDEVKVSYSVLTTGKYYIELFDMLGRTLSKQEISAGANSGTYTISGLSLPAGMYVVKMGNDVIYGTTKAIVR